METFADLNRRLESLIRLGIIMNVQAQPPRVRVKSGNLESDWRPWLTLRAGSSGEWDPPSVGEQCVLLSPSGDQHQYCIADRNAYTAVKAYWHDLDRARKGEVMVDANTKFERRRGVTKRGKLRKRSHLTAVQTKAIEPSTQNIKVLRHVYATEATALQGAKAAWEKLQRGVASFSITLAEGRPELIPEQQVVISGFKPALDSCCWLINKVEHRIEDGGYTVMLELEMKLEDLPG